MGNGIGYLFEKHCLTGLRLGNNQAALTLTYRRKEVDDTDGQRVTAVAFAQTEFFVREKRSQVLKGDTFFRFFGGHTVDADDFVHREIFVGLAVGAHRAFYCVARFEPK